MAKNLLIAQSDGDFWIIDKMCLCGGGDKLGKIFYIRCRKIKVRDF
jgi:hypothetical protein